MHYKERRGAIVSHNGQMGTSATFLPFLLFFFLLLPEMAAADGSSKRMAHGKVGGTIGAIIDYNSRIGKEEKVAMEIAMEDIYRKTRMNFVLRTVNSERQPLRAALAARNLIYRHKVQAILGPQTWEEASLVAEIGSEAHVPILSLADSTPKWATERWPFLLQASRNKSTQMKAIAAIIQSWQWHQVTVICEDIDSFKTGVIPILSDALKEVGAEIIHFLALPPLASSLPEQLEKLRTGQCRIFVVHLSFSLAVQLFKKAKEMNMMDKDYVWITTDPFTSLAHSINASTISSVQGTLGIKSYFPENELRFQDFYTNFRKKFSLKHPEEDNHEPGIFAVDAYDTVWTVCLAMRNGNKWGKHLLPNILQQDFDGLSGKIKFVGRKLVPANVFQIINVVGKSYRELGFWSEKAGFSRTSDERTAFNPSMGSTSFEGFVIDLFKSTVEKMPYPLPYTLISFNGTYDDLVKQVFLKNFDVVVGDVAVVGRRLQYVEFTYPFTVSEVVMIVPVRPETSNKAWLFMKPFTKTLWILIVAVNVYNGFVVWLIERNHCAELRGSLINQLGILIHLAFNTLFSLHGGKLHSNFSRMAMVAWLFFALVITQTYTANLTSILTLQRLEPTVSDIQSLQNSNAYVGYCLGSFVEYFLVETLQFPRSNIKKYDSPEHYAQALRTREIAAAFLEAPYAKLFLAKYCKGFTKAGPSYKVGGFGFAFPRTSPLVYDVNKALLNVSESGQLLRLEDSMIAAEKCVDMDSVDDISSLSPSSFSVLLLLTGGTSSFALLVYILCRTWKFQETCLGHKTIWALMLAVLKFWGHQRKPLSRRVIDEGSF
ncbi:Glutamate receptor [Quillaja saponaria]|uniref:Glutamate receptor n=1 Tax=Quillaja saponaria TaxID=32244 RepID=A0AAD7QJ91_QUISA|nr:Glutamate receptor [Quillaja saponaria]